MEINRDLVIVPVGDLEVNCVILKCFKTRYAVIFDPGDDPDKIISSIKKHEAIPKMILNTHCHYDHIGAVETLKKKFDIPFVIHEMEKEYALDPSKNYSVISKTKISLEPDDCFKDCDTIMIGEIKIIILHTPGHTLGSSCFLIDDVLLSGDSLFAGSIGRTDLYGGNYDQIIHSIKTKLMPLNDSTQIVPGHGRMTSIKDEKRFNPFL